MLPGKGGFYGLSFRRLQWDPEETFDFISVAKRCFGESLRVMLPLKSFYA
ncbi:MAG: hypothetical protein SRB2_03665 [Desulfobacteraceae bacterium Eth-SRB2]|nr:MAG: hypothetical protein SRB2_03665 [Desulfobacteraceae bacterium Eth-SRB2]